jgi:hypothetical protein
MIAYNYRKNRRRRRMEDENEGNVYRINILVQKEKCALATDEVEKIKKRR